MKTCTAKHPVPFHLLDLPQDVSEDVYWRHVNSWTNNAPEQLVFQYPAMLLEAPVKHLAHLVDLWEHRLLARANRNIRETRSAHDHFDLSCEVVDALEIIWERLAVEEFRSHLPFMSAYTISSLLRTTLTLDSMGYGGFRSFERKLDDVCSWSVVPIPTLACLVVGATPMWLDLLRRLSVPKSIDLYRRLHVAYIDHGVEAAWVVGMVDVAAKRLREIVADDMEVEPEEVFDEHRPDRVV